MSNESPVPPADTSCPTLNVVGDAAVDADVELERLLLTSGLGSSEVVQLPEGQVWSCLAHLKFHTSTFLLF